MGNGMNGAMLIVLIAIWVLVGLGFFVWYLWSMSRLFPKLGLPAGQGWIPVWNQWKLIDRAGLPGWTVLFSFVGLGIVTLIMWILAVHRLNTEHGRGGGFTVLGIFIAPLWAMLLANHIQDAGYAVPGYAQSAAAPAPGSWQGLPPVPQQPQASAPQQYAAPVAPAPEFAARPSVQTAPPVPSATPIATPPASAPAPAAARSAFAPPASAHQGSAAPSVAPVPPAPGAPNQWGFSSTTEDAFERLAAEQAPASGSASLLVPEPARPFSWPGPEHSTAPVPPARAAEPAQEAAAPAPAQPAPAPAPAPVAPAQAQAPVPPLPASAVAEQAETSPVDRLPAAGVPDAAPVHAGAAAAAHQAAPAPIAPVEADAEDDDDDRTVVVSRRQRWGIELPDGEVLELMGEDVVVGRKPEAPEGVEVLRIADPTRTLSKSHARLRLGSAGWTVEDLSSTNGTAVVDETGAATALEAGRETEATERLLIGTLEVQLRKVD